MTGQIVLTFIVLHYHCLDNGIETLILYVDFAKAFDSVFIPKLIYKLKSIGVTCTFPRVLCSRLNDRTYRVRVLIHIVTASLRTKAKQRLCLLRKSCVSCDSSALILAFKIYILALLQCCSPLWSPYLITDILCIEAVQINFTKSQPNCAIL